MADFHPEQSEPKQVFSSKREEQIADRLQRLVGQAAADFFTDSCQIMNQPIRLRSVSHIVTHLLRETTGLMCDALEPVSKGKRRAKDYKGQIVFILAELSIKEDEDVAQLWLSMAGQDSRKSLHRFAHRQGLGSVRAASDPEFLEVCEDTLKILEYILRRFQESYSKIFPAIKELRLNTHPGAKDASIVRNICSSNPAAARSFFEGLETPTWLSPLHDSGYFSEVSSPIYDHAKGTVQFPPWAPADYLKKMAAVAPDKVAEILDSIPLTDNIEVHTKLSEIAALLPPADAKRWARREIAWIATQNRVFWRLPHSLTALCNYLTGSGKLATAIELAEAMLLPLPDPRVAEMGKRKARRELFLEAHSRLDRFDYDDTAQKSYAPIIALRPIQAIRSLTGLLNAALRATPHSPQQRKNGERLIEDYSNIWQADLSGKGDGHTTSIKQTLANELFKAVSSLVDKPEKLRAALLFLVSERRTIFHRIAMHFLAERPDSAPELAFPLLIDRTLFLSDTVLTERFRLLSLFYPRLTQEEQKTIFAMIEAGPGWPAGVETYRLGFWEYEHLKPISEYLTEGKKARFEELGKKKDQWYRELQKSQPKPIPPLTTEEMVQKSVGEIVGFISTWVPQERHFSYSPFDMAHNLRMAMSADPEKFASESLTLASLQPNYQSEFFRALVDALGSKRPFKWQMPLQLAVAIVNQGEAKTEHDHWARHAILDLLERGLGDGPGTLTLGELPLVQQILSTLVSHPEPAFDAKKEDLKEFFISYGASIRADAIDSLVHFLLWYRRRTKTDANNLDDLPWARDLLKHGLVDPSPRMLAAYGRWLPHLHLLDAEWVKAKLTIILSEGLEPLSAENAGWNSYVVQNQPTDTMANFLHPHYADAVAKLDPAAKNPGSHWDPHENLTDHLIIFNIRGKAPLDGDLIAPFFLKAPAYLRAHAIGTLGRILNNEDLPPEMLARAEQLWDRRLTYFKANPEQATDGELEKFGFWFTSGKLDPAESLRRLDETLTLQPDMDPAHNIMENLLPLADTYPEIVCACVEKMVMGAKESWAIELWKDDLGMLLPKLSAQPTCYEETLKIISYLASRGYTQFI